MSPELWWYLARASGIVAWALVTVAVVWGLLVSTRVLGGRPGPRWLLDLHRFLGGLAVTFTGIHVGALVADSYVHFDLVDLLVPFASEWQPLPVALGVVALWLLLAVELTSLAMRHLPRRQWRWVHLTSYGLFWLATLHGLTAGTDAGEPLFAWATNLAVVAVVFLTLFRVLVDRRSRGGRGSSTQRPTPPRVSPARAR